MMVESSQAGATQLSLFPSTNLALTDDAPPTQAGSLSADTPLFAATTAFREHMQRQGFSEHTVKAFLSDLRLLARHSGPNVPVGRLGTRNLNDFLSWMLEYRGVPCSPKTYGRRVTTLKVFFNWLHETEVLARDPAAAIPHNRVVTPLPRFLYEDQVDRLLEATRAWMDEDPADPRAFLLVNLLLYTGIKKSECVNVALADIDVSNRQAPVLYVRYKNPRNRHKERKMALPADILPILERYIEVYQPKRYLFECTPRNLEYVLAEAALRADLREGVSFEMLRWTCAVRDFGNGMDADRLRQKLGLSQVTWHETHDKLKKLVGPAL